MRSCTANGKPAVFHRWADESYVVGASPLIGGAPAGEIKTVFGIVEYEDGSVGAIRPTRIVFTDKVIIEQNENRPG